MKKLMLPAAFAALVIAVLVPVGALGYRFELWDLGTAFGLLRWFGRSEALAGAGLAEGVHHGAVVELADDARVQMVVA